LVCEEGGVIGWEMGVRIRKYADEKLSFTAIIIYNKY
jgi:hypothetical protein